METGGSDKSLCILTTPTMMMILVQSKDSLEEVLKLKDHGEIIQESGLQLEVEENVEEVMVVEAEEVVVEVLEINSIHIE